MENEKIIGVVGGMGPYAGLDLVRKIFDHTEAGADADHLPVALLSYPARVPDRTAFLLGRSDENPAEAIAAMAVALDRLGAVVAGMPCNTAHAPRIFDAVLARLREEAPRLRLLNMIDETIRFLREEHGNCTRIGVLATLGAYRTRLHADALEAAGLEAILPDENVQETIVHRTIYDPSYGLKAHMNPVSMIARQSLVSAVEHLREQGAEAVLLACTELPLALPEPELDGTPLIDPTLALARALIRETYPEKLKPL
ncbi:amino acid racemase [Rhodocaloribacter litoris]|uniref:aspartate/glutamate racemase family protein n=1 Tax=Rhodocaloribacter litoris TaxID=2558931 RepID=UPI00141F0075|nr:amino acid racemase [Rhodocaloribacter litoris]QXD14246.1 amino acid racemase [Rhodocaloribacter litoris]GIV59878.1 MAG: aspartate racemase [Rhodothermaceae bacterium]